MNERPLRVIAADDELVARKRLTRLLESMPGVEVVGVHEDAAGVLAQLKEEAVDVLVLDVQMPGLDGLELSAVLGQDAPFVVFATAHPEHAVRAFDLGAVDYVLKPIDAARLGKAIARARELRRAPAAETIARIAVTTRDGIVLVDPDTVTRVVFDGTLVELATIDGATYLSEATLQDLLAQLPGDAFCRVHRRAIVNLRQVALLRPTETGGYVAQLRTGDTVPVSRQAARKLRRWLGIARG